jgi:hypothetical protein
MPEERGFWEQAWDWDAGRAFDLMRPHPYSTCELVLPSFEQITNTCKYKTWPCQEYNRFKTKYPILVLWKCKYSTTSLQYPISLKPVCKFGPAVEHYSLIQHIELSEIGSHWLLLHVLANQREDKVWLVRQMAANMAQKAGDNWIWCLSKHLM